MVRTMMQLKRRPTGAFDGRGKPIMEPWLDYSIRSFRRAKTEINLHARHASQALLANRETWSGHVSRFGTGPREHHLCKLVASWRSKAWWNYQDLCNGIGWRTIRHAHRGRPRRWEEGLPVNWLVSPNSAATVSN